LLPLLFNTFAHDKKAWLILNWPKAVIDLLYLGAPKHIMPIKSSVSVYCVQHPIFLCGVVCVLTMLFSSCGLSSKTDTVKEAYYDTLLLKAEKLVTAKKDPSQFLDSAFRQHPNVPLSVKIKKLYFLFGYFNSIQKNYPKAMKYADSMLALVNNRKDKTINYNEEAIANLSKGDVLLNIKNYSEAYKYYYNGKIADIKSSNPCTYSEYSFRLGMSSYQQADYTTALDYFKKTFDESSSCPENDFSIIYRKQQIFDNIAICYAKLGQTDSATTYYDLALQYINSIEAKYPERGLLFTKAKGVIYGNQGQLLQAGNHFPEAEDLYKKSININSQSGYDAKDAKLTQIHLAKLYKNWGRTNDMLSVLQQVRTGLDTLANDNVEMDWNDLMWHYYNDVNDPAKAYEYLYNYMTLKDYLSSVNKQIQEHNVAEHVKEMEAQYEITLLKKSNNIQQSSLLIATVFFVMALLLIAVFIQSGKKTRKNILTLTDLNEQMNAQKEQLQNALEELEKRNKEKDRILRVVVHDLRNPIAGISSLTDMILERHECSPEQKELIELAQKACANSLELINDILEATLNNNVVPIQKKPVNINNIVGNSIELLRFKAAEKNQTIHLISPEESVIVMAGGEKIWRVISNLITNAIKFSPSGAEIQVSVINKKNDVEIAVHDNGIGIPDSIKPKVFDMFTEAKRFGTYGEKPFGLGLSICKQIIESHDGKIWFESHPECGTTFHVRLHKLNIIADTRNNFTYNI
jgi:signal transduction histidine kinase